MPPKPATKAKSASKKRSRIVADVNRISDDEILPTKPTKRSYAFYNPIDPPEKSTKSKTVQKSAPATTEKSDDSDDEPLKRRSRPKPKNLDLKESATASALASTPKPGPTSAPVKESVKAKAASGKIKSAEANLSKTITSNVSSTQIGSNGSLKNSKKQPLASTQPPANEFENQENRDLTTPASGEKTLNKRSKSQRAPTISFEQLQAAYDDLKERYNHLTSLRITEAERHLDEYRIKLQAANRTLEQYKSKVEPQLEASWRTQDMLRSINETLNAKVRSLQHQLRDYDAKEKQRAKEDRTRERTLSMEKLLASPEVNQQSATFVKSMEMYQNLTGLKVVATNQHLWGKSSPVHTSEVHPETWECEHSGPLGTLRFSLSYDSKTDLVTYTPSIDRDKDAKLLQALPEYMTVEIEFERQFESKLFWRILNYNHDHDDDS